MEYRRRKRRRVTRQSANGAAKTVVALVVIAAIVYVVSASALGSWISEKVIAPAFAAFDNLIADNSTTPPAAEDSSALNLKDPDKPLTPTATTELNIPAVECYALQIGVFGDKTNADNEASALQGRGAGGYVMEDAGKYRVLAAAYSTQDSLKQVRDQLKEEGIDSASYVFSAPDSTLRITASEEQLNGITAGFEALSKLLDDMAETTLEFDKQQQTAAEGKAKITALLSGLKSAKQSFLKVATVEHPVLDAAKVCYDTCEAALTELNAYDKESFVDFSAKMKYTHISIIHAYVKLLDKVSNI